MSVRRWALIVLAAALLAAGCGRRAQVATGELEAVAHPALDAVEAAARQQLGEARDALESRLAAGEDRAALADAYGTLGELYHSYQLLAAAAACYRNAAHLDPESYLWPYYLGVVSQASGDLAAARASFEQALAKRPDDGPTRLRLAEAALAAGDAAAAERELRPFADDGRFAAAAHFGLGRAAAAQGDAAAAVAHFERTLALQPQAGTVHHALGLALRQLGREDEAAAQLAEKGGGEVTFDDPVMTRLESLAVSSGALLKRGNRALVNGRPQEAAALFRQAVAADPAHGEARRNLALALMQRGEVDEALLTLEEGVKVAPDNVWIHFDLGNAHLAKGQTEAAIRSFTRAVEIAPDFASGHFNLANTLISVERWQEALPHLEQVLAADPRDGRARYLDAMARHETGDTAGAVARLRQLLQDEPGNLVARQGLATVYTEARQLADAMGVYEQGLALDLPDADQLQLRLQLAELAWRNGQRPQAIAHWRAAVALAPDSSQAHTALGNGLQLSGQRAEARSEFARAVELDPKNATAWLSEATLWILDSDFRRARERLSAALQQVPDHPGLNNTAARLLATCPDGEVRDGRLALQLARRAYTLESSVDNAETLAMALAEIGQFEEALKWQRGLIQQAAQSGDRALFQRLVSRLQLYEKRQPVRISG